MQDPHYGFRDPVSWEPVGEVEWTTWDYALMSALQLIEDFTDQNGLPVWEKEADHVIVEAVKKVDKFESAKERTTSKKNYKSTPGEYFVPRMKLMPGYEEDDWPTFDEWARSQQEED